MRSTLRFFVAFWIGALPLPAADAAELKPATILVPEPTAWVGQRLSFVVELRAPGPFDGAASFSIPRIPRTVVMKVGNPVVSSEEVDGESVTVQAHEFALFSQQSGTVEIPPFEVRFSHRTGFTGPVVDTSAKLTATKVEIRRPPGSDENAFLITTTSLEVTEKWDARPGPTDRGAVFHRTITQQAGQVTGMALAPPPDNAPDGIRSYPGQPVVSDRTERGDFTGDRTDTVTYVMREPGVWTLPAITYVWWDPEKKQYGSRTLPGVAFQVTAVPTADAAPPGPARGRAGRIAAGLILAGLLIVGLLIVRQRSILSWWRALRKRWEVAERVTAKELLRACRRNDPRAAEIAWGRWLGTQPAEFKPGHELADAVQGMHRFRFGPQPGAVWGGRDLEVAFRRQLAHDNVAVRPQSHGLPVLNGQGVRREC